MITLVRSSHQGVLCKKVFEACNFIKKETLAQVFSCEFCEISKNTFFTEHLYTTASIGPRSQNNAGKSQEIM